jgi:hypothetical protein
MKNHLTMTDFESGDTELPMKEITITIRNLADLDKLVELEVSHAIDAGENFTSYGGRTVSRTEREITIRALHTIKGNAVGLVFSREILGLCLTLLQQYVGGQSNAQSPTPLLDDEDDEFDDEDDDLDDEDDDLDDEDDDGDLDDEDD